jgi:hypothetical protein
VGVEQGKMEEECGEEAEGEIKKRSKYNEVNRHCTKTDFVIIWD